MRKLRLQGVLRGRTSQKWVNDQAETPEYFVRLEFSHKPIIILRNRIFSHIAIYVVQIRIIFNNHTAGFALRNLGGKIAYRIYVIFLTFPIRLKRYFSRILLRPASSLDERPESVIESTKVVIFSSPSRFLNI